MTAMATGRPQMRVEEFEQIAAAAPETVTLEFINGRLGVKAVPDGDHGAIIMWLLRQCMQHRPELDLHIDQGLRVEQYRSGCARPDGVLAPVAHFAGQGEWAAPEGVLMAVEITSYDTDTDRRDRVEKPAAYAQAGIPVYLLVDRERCEVAVHSDPRGGRYRTAVTRAYGDPVDLPAPVGFRLETEILKTYVR
ncbi:Uma2 family endonuclease [Kitasatospora sp. MAP5-34]|uniref:Uma2 family endonuclease n=1 Tax=Kitasatospora sp. MAP5-34 TaxID=3035102 RepID=UPI00247475E2|nr:Uma2 family endonuclease [Kitasatospora sp. MAP5-34]